MNISKYRRAFAWQRPGEDPDNLRTYAGPHHDIIDGRLTCVWRGVRAAMGSLVFGARGGRISDDGERRAVYGHLSKHYKDFDKPIPEFREYTDEELKELFAELYKEAEAEGDDVETSTDDSPAGDDNHTDNELTPEEEEALAEAIGQWLESLNQTISGGNDE